MKKQYEAVWFTIDGNRHVLYPLYAESQEKAKMQVEDFIDYSKKRRFLTAGSIVVREA